jgi:hypothetical protein
VLKNLSKPTQYMLIGTLAFAAYFAISSTLGGKPVPTVKKATVPKSTKKGEVVYLPEDFKAKFASLNTPVKNTFKPLVVKTVAARTGPSAVLNNLPPEFAGGEQNWIYTGSAEIDGVLQALLENKTTGDNVFLRVGDTWKGISVEEITDDTLVLSSPDTGTTRTLRLPTEDLPVAGPGGFSPASVNPGLRGNIGPMSIQPDPNSMMGGAGGNNNGFNNGGNFGNFGNGNGGNTAGGNAGTGRRRGGGGRGRNNGGGG